MAEPEAKQCKDCAYYTPTFAGVGRCKLEGTPQAKFWVSDPEKTLLVLQSFSCQQFKPTEPINHETL